MRRNRRNFVYYDVTPYGERNENNCVYRALTLASGLPYYEIARLLEENGYCNQCDMLVLDCYDSLIEDYFGYEPIDIPYDITVGEFAEMHTHGIYLVRMEGHISTIIDGESWDIFDCTREVITNAWRVK